MPTPNHKVDPLACICTQDRAPSVAEPERFRHYGDTVRSSGALTPSVDHLPSQQLIAFQSAIHSAVLGA